MKPPKLRLSLLCLIVFSLLTMSIFGTLASSAADQLSIGNTSASSLQDWQNKVEASVLTAAMSGQTEFLIYLNSQADLSGAEALATKEEKGQFVYEQLSATAQATQPAVQQTLDSFGVASQSFWITNAIWARGNLAVVQAVALRPEVAFIYASGGGSLQLPPQSSAAAESSTSTSALESDPNPEPGLLKVNADDVWARGILGEGVVVA
ncbi:MAG: hypothetical protein ACRD8U_10145, partial [Pyrinomonadaceae bacterium]